MGRLSKYNEENEKRIANNKKAMRYYFRNKEEIKRKNRDRYHKLKNNI